MSQPTCFNDPFEARPYFNTLLDREIVAEVCDLDDAAATRDFRNKINAILESPESRHWAQEKKSENPCVGLGYRTSVACDAKHPAEFTRFHIRRTPGVSASNSLTGSIQSEMVDLTHCAERSSLGHPTLQAILWRAFSSRSVSPGLVSARNRSQTTPKGLRTLPPWHQVPWLPRFGGSQVGEY